MGGGSGTAPSLTSQMAVGYRRKVMGSLSGDREEKRCNRASTFLPEDKTANWHVRTMSPRCTSTWANWEEGEAPECPSKEAHSRMCPRSRACVVPPDDRSWSIV